MNILVLGVQVPFTRGGAELLIERLVEELRSRGHRVDLVQLPFSALPKERIVDSVLYWRGLDITSFGGQNVDLVISTKFPSYCVRHPRNVVWLIHQHRQAYDLYGSGFSDLGPEIEDESIRQIIAKADETSLHAARAIFTISPTVSARLHDYLNVESKALMPPPPLAGRYRQGEKGNYILSVGRLCTIKRPDLLVRSLPSIDEKLRVKIVGVCDEPGFEAHLNGEIERNRVGPRVDLLGRVSDEELLDLYANAFAVFYAPYNEDYGFVTLEALLSGKPVVTARDSGGTLAFIEDGKNGFVVQPNAERIAEAFNALRDESLYARLQAHGTESARVSSWSEIVTALTLGNS